MSLDDKLTHPYSELGGLLQGLRSKRWTSVWAFVDATKLSFDRGKYAAFENGDVLPTPTQLVEIARAVGVNARPLLTSWARVQMPDAEAKLYFPFEDDRRSEADAHSRLFGDVFNWKKEIASHRIPLSKRNDTWVPEHDDREHIIMPVWMLDLIIMLTISYPHGVTFKELGLDDRGRREAFEEKYLQRWIDQAHVIVEFDRYKTTKEFFYFPKDEYWDPVRTLLRERVLASVVPQLTPANIQNGAVHRTIVLRKLTSEQYKVLKARLEQLELEVANIRLRRSDDVTMSQTYVFISLLAPRKLGPFE